MILLTDKFDKHLIIDVNHEFCKLTLEDIYGVLEKIMSVMGYSLLVPITDLPKDLPVDAIAYKGEFGITTLNKIADGLKCCFLASVAKNRNQKIGFIAGEFGLNSLKLLCEVCNNGNNIYLYNPDCTIPSIGLTDELKKYIKRQSGGTL